ncbi:hypothetical protein MUK42_02521 [Musa troglodytarum]|uniref:Uncharacterized protein n=1 Tax=Musa troglodytarum TaxID=320322 RepID=A0A9E7L5J1_9LILI|nr:hypothetical protein MUK42_02521 [Musa troglodytarum]
MRRKWMLEGDGEQRMVMEGAAYETDGKDLAYFDGEHPRCFLKIDSSFLLLCGLWKCFFGSRMFLLSTDETLVWWSRQGS